MWLAEGEEIEAIAITSIEIYPKWKVCLLRYVSGNMGTILSGSDVIENWAREQGCARMETHARKGWERVSDWDVVQVVLRKELFHDS